MGHLVAHSHLSSGGPFAPAGYKILQVLMAAFQRLLAFAIVERFGSTRFGQLFSAIDPRFHDRQCGYMPAPKAVDHVTLKVLRCSDRLFRNLIFERMA
jgi:hypothetical protein